MTNKTSLTIFTAGLLAAAVLFTPYTSSAAQGVAAATSEFSAQAQQDNKGQSKKTTPAARSAPQRAVRAAPRVAAPQRAPRTVTQTRATSHVVRQPKATSRVVRQPKATSHVVKQPKATSRVVRQPKATSRIVKQPKATSRSQTTEGTRKSSPQLATRRKVVSPVVLRALSRHAAQEPLPRRACAGSRRVAPAELSLPAIITRRGAADTACVMAAAGGRLARSAPWARS